MDELIYQRIQEKLDEIEEKENVEILLCVESGSRAWGFESPDSDYDVRFIYARKKDFYLKLEKTRDVIEWQLDDVFDINGWDIQKTLRLLYKSNPTVFEWSNSPIVYRVSDKWDSFSRLLNDYFDVKKGLYHYFSTARKNVRIYLKGEKIKLKKYFYVLRPLLACEWIISNGTPPPILFSELCESCLPTELRPAVNKLVEEKMKTSELGEGDRIDILHDYIKAEFEKIEQIINSTETVKDNSWGPLNKAFLQVISTEGENR